MNENSAKVLLPYVQNILTWSLQIYSKININDPIDNNVILLI